ETARQPSRGDWNGPSAMFRSFGTHAVWFPRGLLLRLAAREAVAQLVGQWTEDENGERYLESRPVLAAPRSTSEVDAGFARVLAEPGLQPAALGMRMEE